MEYSLITTKIFKEKSEILLSKLPEKAKNELASFFQYLFFKYNIELKNEISEKDKYLNKNNFSFLKSLELTKNSNEKLSEIIINERRNEKW